MFGKLGKEWELTNELFSDLEEFICTLYGYKEVKVNKVQWLKFRDKHTKQNNAKKLLNYTVYEQILFQKCRDRLCKAILMLPISVVMVGTQRVQQNGFITYSQTISLDPLFYGDDFEPGSEYEESNNDCWTYTILKADFV